MMSTKNIYILLPLFLLSVITEPTTGQSLGEVKQMKAAVAPPDSQPHYHFNTETTNELTMLSSGLFLFYKAFFSSQDANKCTFTPSCSQYMRQATESQGPIFGVMNGFDRLTRCHNLCRDQYKIAPSGLLIDPIERDPFTQK